MVGPYVAATIVTLVQFLRLRDRRLLAIAALFAFQAQALGREWTDPLKDLFQNAACLAGLALVVLLSLRKHPASHGTTPAPGARPD
jgi:hypothetical protein